MEQRFSPRTFIDVSVALHHNGRPLGHYRTRDIDSRAVFIDAWDTGLGLHDIVDMDFMARRGRGRKFKRKGVITRVAADGLVAALVSADTVVFDTLEEVLKGEPVRCVA